MRLPDSFIQELIDKNDIESVVSRYVPTLKRRGRNLVGLCPFHGEKTPSFNLYPENSSFYCFGCGAGGDVITFIKRIENLSYMDAVRFLADRVGMRMPEESRENDAVSRLRTRVLEANREAARIYHRALYAPEGARALTYYHGRGYTDATIRRFGLGFAPGGWTYLVDRMREKGFREDELQAAFLAAKSSKTGRFYDVFRERAIIPIIDVRGTVVAFGGRVLDDSKPKYINTENTPAYSKSRNLFALNFAKTTGRELNLCEGYMDVIAMHQAGFTNTVAALGTAFPDEQIQLIARYADRINLIFDADGAGQKATRRAIDNLRKTGLDVHVVTIPDGKDPDEFLKRNGAEAFKRLLGQSANAVEYRLLEIGKTNDIRTTDGRVAYLRAAVPILAALDSPVERDVYAGRLGELLSVSKDAILQEVAAAQKKQQRGERLRELGSIVRQEKKELRELDPLAEKFPRAASAEESLLGTLILHPDRIRRVAAELPPEQFVTDLGRRIYSQLIERDRQGLLVELSFLSADYDDAEMSYLTRMVRRAGERAVSDEDIAGYIAIIREEHALRGLKEPGSVAAEDIDDILAVLRAKKQRGG